MLTVATTALRRKLARRSKLLEPLAALVVPFRRTHPRYRRLSVGAAILRWSHLCNGRLRLRTCAVALGWSHFRYRWNLLLAPSRTHLNSFLRFWRSAYMYALLATYVGRCQTFSWRSHRRSHAGLGRRGELRRVGLNYLLYLGRLFLERRQGCWRLGLHKEVLVGLRRNGA